MMDYALYSFLIFGFCDVLIGFPEEGLSVSMVSSKQYDYNKWQTLTGWRVSSQLAGQYIRVLAFDNTKAVVTIQTSGIYYVSFHLILEDIQDSLTAAISINNKYDNFPIVSALRVNDINTVGAAGFLKLTASDTICLLAYSTKSYIVSKNTALIIRYHGDPLSASGFLFSLPEYLLNSQTTTMLLGPWVEEIYGHFYSTLSFRPGQYEFTIPLSGSYMITLNLILTILQFDYDIKLDVYASDTLIFSMSIEEIPFSTATVNLNEIIHLNVGDVLRIELTTNGARINLRDLSSWSVLLMNQLDNVNNGFHRSLDKNLLLLDTKNYQTIGNWVIQNNTLYFSQFLSSTIENGKSFNTKSVGMFYVTTDLSFSLFLNISQYGSFSIAFFQEPNVIFSEKRVIPKSQGKLTNVIYGQNYRVSLAGVYKLSKVTPISIAIKGENITKFVINKESTFAVIETSSSYPGFHAALDSSMHVANRDRNKLDGWTTLCGSGFEGLYDFTNGLSSWKDKYTVSEDGLYLAVANVVVSDVDDGFIYGFIKQLNTDPDIIIAKTFTPSSKTAVTFGGFFLLKRTETVFVELKTDTDEDWKVLSSGFSVAYLGLSPIYFLSGLNDNFFVNSKNVIVDNWKDTTYNLLTNGVFVAPYDGVYFTVANIILDVKNGFSENKVYISLNRQEIKGIFSKKRTTTAIIVSLFLSGSFYASKSSVIALAIQTDIIGTKISVGSTWGVVLVSTSNQASGALGVLNSDTYFDQQNEWQNAGNWMYKDNQYNNGQYLRSNTLSFDDPTYIEVLEAGIYLISANIEVFYTIPNPQLYKISINLNDDLNKETGLSLWQTSVWPKQTLNLCGALYLKENDKVYVRVLFTSFPNTIVLSGSGLSIELLSSRKIYSTFFAMLKDDYKVGLVKGNLSNWYFPTLLASTSFDLNTGVLIIPQSGFYMLSFTLLVEKASGTLVNGITVALLINSAPKEIFSYVFEETKMHFHFSNISVFNFQDQISLCVINIFDPSVSMFNISEEIISVKISKTASSFSLSYIPEMKASRSWAMNIFTPEVIQVLNKDITLQSWSDPENQLSASASGDYFVKTSGIYLLKSKFNLLNLNGSIEVSFVGKNNAKICVSFLNGGINCSVEMNCFTELLLNDAVSIVLKSFDAPLTVDIGSLRIANLITTNNFGFGKTLLSEIYLEPLPDNWYSIGPWTFNKTGYYGLFNKKFQSFENQSIVLLQGTYQVVVNLIVDLRKSSFLGNHSIQLMSGLFLDNELLISMFQQTLFTAQQNVMTINLVGNLIMKKWTQMEIKIKLSSNANVTLLQTSSWGVALIENSPFSNTSDKGPIMLTKFSPANYSTWVVGISKEWKCEASGDGNLAYIWYKNNEIIDVQYENIGYLKIAGNINDSGSYSCVVQLDNINVSSNSLYINIYDIDECALKMNNCSTNATCFNTPGSFFCQCNSGFSGDGQLCNDINECLLNTSCALNAICENVPGSWNCNCQTGWNGTNPKNNCTDINECEINSNICQKVRSMCINTPGSYNCICMEGWRNDGVNCIDINECLEENFQCDINAFCLNTNGSYNCICNKGFEGNGKYCENINECLPEYDFLRSIDNKCVNNSVCVDTIGSYTCNCQNGFEGNGTVSCNDINECDNPTFCNANADCINTMGSAQCKCRTGWTGVGKQCTDIDECLESNNCKNGNCSNTIGSYTCVCFTGYQLNGVTCQSNNGGSTAAQTSCGDPKSYSCMCADTKKRDNNILCNGLFLALIILSVIAIIVVLFVVKYMKSRKLKKIGPVKVQRDKYIEMENESEL
ncbi:uncharacterized protein LOC100212257 isoform X2 [Hydra vulgaris]|uniref:uncharacterized protein LOC100212257 isoform X2 n=1 Tax=Hydra vulgaris TaxID=6087 RepID=UPI00064134CD|nr:uncharacterized protein LOC100212257 isoform X1 [Hydra vulgaris]